MNYHKLNNRQFNDCTGCTREKFAQLLSDYESTFFSEYGQTYEEYVNENVTEPPKFKTLEDSLFFVLFQLKNGMIMGALGAAFDMASSTAHTNFERYSKLLDLTLEKRGVMPKRSFENVEEFEAHVSDTDEVIFDGTENPTERPKDYEAQKKKYSGKKGTHTDIALVLSDKRTWIYYVSKYYPGSQVDIGILKLEFTPGKGWFRKLRVLVDLGFIGIDKLYEIKELIIGEKKPRKSKNNPNPSLTTIQKEHNKSVSKKRIYVEHSIGKMKKFHILKNRCRIKCEELKNRILGICAGLWNYCLSSN